MRVTDKRLEVLNTISALQGLNSYSIFNDGHTFEYRDATVCFKSNTITVHTESSASLFNTPEGNRLYYAFAGVAKLFNMQFLG